MSRTDERSFGPRRHASLCLPRSDICGSHLCARDVARPRNGC
jgi:hypothetical protein